MRLGVAGGVLAVGGGALAPSLPAPVEAALARAQIPREAVSIYAAPVEAQRPVRLAWQTRTAMNPASVMKLVTTYAALEQLGPAYVWRTPVYLDGVVDQGAFRGTVYIQGAGDPKLVSERLWLLLGRLQGMGVKVIVGDVVLDHSAFQVAGHDAAAFDNEPFRPYNAGPDALLINYKTKEQGARVTANGANAMPVVSLIFAAGIFMGIMSGTKMIDAMSKVIISSIPEAWGPHFAVITALISLPGTFFLTNDAFYFGVLPVLVKAAATYNVPAEEMARAALIGQGSHLLSPLVPSTYLLVGLGKVEFGDLQKFAILPAIGISAIWLVTALALGHIHFG